MNNSKKMKPMYVAAMKIDEQERLAMKGNNSRPACAARLKAARLYTGKSQIDFAAEAGVGNTALNNMEKGKAFPTRQVMIYLYRAHRIDFNFMINGDFAQLPSDIHPGLFAALEISMSELDQSTNSDPAPSAARAQQA